MTANDELNIPVELFGREAELAKLHDAYRWATLGSTQLVLLSGQPGAGKTALAHELLKSVAGTCYSAVAKFDPYESETPYEPFVRCLRHLFRRLLTLPEQRLRPWREALQQVVHMNEAIIAELIPESRLMLDCISNKEETPALETKQRIERLLHRIVLLFARVEYPLVLVFDDVQWAAPSSLEMLHAILDDPASQNLLLIAIYRDTEEGQAVHTIEAILGRECVGCFVRRLALKPLTLAALNRLIAASLRIDEEQTYPLAHALFVKSVGNPFYSLQLIQNAVRQEHVRFDPACGRWTWDLAAIGSYPGIEGQLVYLTDRLQKLAPDVCTVVVTAACLGSPFDTELLVRITKQPLSIVGRLLSDAVQEGLLTPTGDDGDGERTYAFAHDRIRQAAYSLLDDDRRTRIHYEAAVSLLPAEDEQLEERQLYAAANHFNRAIPLLTPALRECAVRLNELASHKAKQAAAYTQALHYARAALELLADSERPQRFAELFGLSLLRTECEYLCGRYDEAEAHIAELLRNVDTWQKRALVYRLQIELYSTTGRYVEAVRIGLEALREKGIRITERPGKLTVLKELMIAKRLLASRLEELPQLPEADDADATLLMELLFSLNAPSFFSNREVFAVLASKFIRVALHFGSSRVAPAFYASYAMLLGTALGDYRTAYRLGQIAVQTADEMGHASIRCKVYVMFYGVVSPWYKYDAADETKLAEAANLGLESGDNVYASYAVGAAINLAYTRAPLQRMLQLNQRFLSVLEQMNEEFVFLNACVYIDLAKRLGNPAGDVEAIDDGRGDERAFLADTAADESGAMTLYQWHTYKTQLAFLFGRPEEALKHAGEADRYEALSAHAPHLPVHHLYQALAIAAAADGMEGSRRKACLRLFRHRLRQFRRWARSSPDNFADKLCMLEAESARLQGQGLRAVELYDKAIAAARAKEFHQYAGLACELAGKYHAAKGRERIAAVYLQEAWERYGSWGAKAKQGDLIRMFPDWLAEARSMDFEAQPALMQEGEPESEAWQHVADAPVRDAAVLLKSTMSPERGADAEQWLQRILRALVAASKADYGFLIVPVGEAFHVEIGASASDGVLYRSIPLQACVHVSDSLVRYAARTGESVVLDHAAQDELFGTDPVLLGTESVSVCCMPLITERQTAPLLYVYNRSAVGGFTGDQIELMRVMGMQALFAAKLAALSSGPNQERGLYDANGTAADVDLSNTGCRDFRQEKDDELGPVLIDPLTEREAEVLQLMAAGLTNKEIAIELGVTAGTIKVHIHNIFSKLQVNRRTKAVAEAKRQRLLG